MKLRTPSHTCLGAVLCAGLLAILLPLPGEAQDDADGGFGDITSFLPLNQPQSEVRIPSVNPDGTIKTLIEADVVTRIDDDNLRLKNMTITIFDDEGNPNMRVLTTGAVFNVKTNVLSSDQRTKSIHSDFIQEGDSMTFNTETRIGKMMGNVVTHVVRSPEFSSPEAAAEPSQ